MASRCVQLSVYLFDVENAFFTPQAIPTPESALNFLEIAYDQKDQLFALADAGNGVIQRWQEKDGKLAMIDSFHAPGFTSFRDAKGFEYNPDLQLAAWGTADNKIILWDLTQMAVAQEYQLDFPFRDFVISPNGTMLAIQSETGTKVYLRDQAGFNPVETGMDRAIAGPMGFGGVGKILAIGNGTQIWVFDTSTWSQITKMQITSTGDSEVDSIFVNQDGTTIAVGMNPVQAGPIETSYLIDIQTGLETGPFDEIMTPILSPNNYQLASMGAYLNEGITLWNLDVGSWIARACQIANRNLTQAEWGQYMGNVPYQLTCPNLPAPVQP
jgi:WD40 repeat protein